MNIKLKFKIILLSLFLFTISLSPEDIRIVYSSNLTGNLYSCICGLKLSVGLAKRASFLKQIGVNPSKDILVDTGNSLDVKSSTDKANAIFESFQKLGYHAVGIGVNDLQENTISILEDNRYQTQSANLFQKGFFRTSSFGKQITYLKREDKTYGIINLTSPTILYNLPSEVKSKLVVQNLETTLSKLTSSQGEMKADNWIILLNGSKEEALKLASLNSNFLLIYGGEKNSASPKSGYSEVNGVRIYSTGDLLGDKLGIITLTEQTKGYTVKSSEVIEMNIDKLTDSAEILSIMKKYNIKPE